jgi:hypothetical protein
MSHINKITLKFLQELRSNEESLETLNYLIDLLETKSDPDPEEIQLVDSAYQFVEKLKTLEAQLKKYIGGKHESLPGNKLNSLYNSSSHTVGTQKLFE